MNRTALLLLALAAPLPARASISVTGAWSPAADVIYLTATDDGTPDRLIGARTEVAEAIELYESREAGGGTRLHPVAALPISPTEPLRLAPGGSRLRLVGLNQRLRPGDRFPLTLVFAQAGEIEAEVIVGPVGR